MSEQALGWFPLGLGLIVEDEPSHVHVYCVLYCSESSVDSLKIGEILEEQKLDLEGEEFNDFFHGRSDTNSESVQRNG